MVIMSANSADVSILRLSIDTADSPNLKKEALKLWMVDQHHTAKSLCKAMDLKYAEHGNTFRTYLWEFRCQLKYGSLQGSHNLAVRHRRVFECMEAIRLSEESERVVLGLGWKVTSNRNRMLLFNGRNGSVVWYRNGLVLIYLQGKAPLARAVELFWAAFGFLGDKELVRLSKLIIPRERHTTFDLGEPVPRFEITHYQKSHGLTIKSDGTHPHCIEVGEEDPLYLAHYDLLLDRFGEEIKAHLDLITAWKNEAEAARLRRTEAEAQPRRQDDAGLLIRLCLWLSKDVRIFPSTFIAFVYGISN